MTSGMQAATASGATVTSAPPATFGGAGAPPARRDRPADDPRTRKYVDG